MALAKPGFSSDETGFQLALLCSMERLGRGSAGRAKKRRRAVVGKRGEGMLVGMGSHFPLVWSRTRRLAPRVSFPQGIS